MFIHHLPHASPTTPPAASAAILYEGENRLTSATVNPIQQNLHQKPARPSAPVNGAIFMGLMPENSITFDNNMEVGDRVLMINVKLFSHIAQTVSKMVSYHSYSISNVIQLEKTALSIQKHPQILYHE